MTDKAPLQPTVKTTPVAPYLGGKRNLAKRICRIIEQVPHTAYAEPFVGMGGVFLRRSSRARSELINDRSRDVANLFRILQRHYPQFLEVMRFQLCTRSEFERLVATDPDTLTDLERAARFLYLQRTAFGGKISGRNFGVSVDRPARFNLMTLEPLLEQLHERLSSVTIESMNYDAFIDRYDRQTTLFYLDPPYWGCEDDYGKNIFAADDFQSLAEQLGRIKGKFLLSINDVPEIREIFSGFELTPVRTSYSIGAKNATAGQNAELLIGNFTPS